MLAIEIMANLFCGFAPGRSKEHKLGNPTVMTAWDIEAFTDHDRFDRLLNELCERVQANPPAPGIEEILLPGEIEYRTTEARKNSRMPVPAGLWEELQRLNE